MSTFKLYLTPTSCGAASFLAGHIAGLTFDAETVDLGTHKTASGADFYAINPKGNVPTIVLPDGTLLAENIATLNYIADQGAKVGKAPRLSPAHGTTEWYVFLHQISFIATELHKGGYGPLFGPLPDAVKATYKTTVLPKAFKNLEGLLGSKAYLGGAHITVADLYAYIVLSWSPYVGVSLDVAPAVKGYFERVKALPQLVAAHAALQELVAKEKAAH